MSRYQNTLDFQPNASWGVQSVFSTSYNENREVKQQLFEVETVLLVKSLTNTLSVVIAQANIVVM